jgi:hypothetical protein
MQTWSSMYAQTVPYRFIPISHLHPPTLTPTPIYSTHLNSSRSLGFTAEPAAPIAVRSKKSICFKDCSPSVERSSWLHDKMPARKLKQQRKLGSLTDACMVAMHDRCVHDQTPTHVPQTAETVSKVCKMIVAAVCVCVCACLCVCVRV